MTLEYQTPPQRTADNHDQIYTTLVGVFAFFLLMGTVGNLFMSSALTMPQETRAIFLMTVVMGGIWLLAALSVLIIRLAFPSYRRWPTLALNLVLLLFIPFGTALGVYGLWKVDKQPNSPRL
jgi:nitrate reductase gamma subunit